MNEAFRGYEWLYSTLSAGTALVAVVSTRLYRHHAPQGAVVPYVVFRYEGGHDVAGVGTARVMTEGVYQVRATGLWADYATIKSAADQIDTLLQGASGTTSDTTIAACVREEVFELNDLADDGQSYAHVGGLYRLTVYKT